MKAPSLLLALSLFLSANSYAQETDVQTTNIVVFDASGSMWNRMETSTRIEIAREVMKQFLDGYDTRQPLGVIAYGHRKRGDCSDIEILVPPANIDPAVVSKQINALLPKGKTPLAESLRRAGELIPKTSEDANILLITDGLETCDGDPCAVAKEMIESGIKVRAHVVGFGLTKAEADSLACIAGLTGGQMFNPSNGDELLDALKQSVAAEPAAVTEKEPMEEKTFEAIVNLKDIGFGLPSGFMKWTATGEAGIIRDLGTHKGSRLATRLPPGTWSIVADGAEGRGEGNVIISGPARAYLDFTAAQIDAEILNESPLTAGVQAYIKLRINTPPPGNALSHFKIGIFPQDDPLTKIIASGQNRYVFAGKKIVPGDYNASVHMPKIPGRYKLAFVRTSGEAVLAEKFIDVVAVPELKLDVPERVVAGSVFSPGVTSGFANSDRLNLFKMKEDGSRGNQISTVSYATHIQQNEGLIDAPAEPGKYLLELIAKTADSKNSPKTTAEFTVVSTQDFNAAAPEAAMEGEVVAGKIPVSLMLDGDAEQPKNDRELMWSVRPVKKSPEGKWVYDREHQTPMGESRMLASPEIQWDLSPGFWEVSVLVGDNRLNRVLIAVDPAANEHAFLISAEKLPKPAVGQPTQWMIPPKGGEPVLTEAAAPMDPKAKIDVRLSLQGIADDARVTWSINPLDADGVTLSRDGRMGGGGNTTGGDRMMALVPGKWKLTAKSDGGEFFLIADVAPGKIGQVFTLENQSSSGAIKLDISKTISFQENGFIPIDIELPQGFKGTLAMHPESDPDGKAVFEIDAQQVATASDPGIPMPAQPGTYELRIVDSDGNLPIKVSFEIAAQEAAAQEGKEPELRRFEGGVFGTGTVMVEMNGKTEEFVTTSTAVKAPPQKLDNPDAQKFLDSMEGKVIDTAVLQLLAGSLYVSLDAYGNIDDFGPEMMGEKRTSFAVKFALDPKTLDLKPGARELTYHAPGSRITDGKVAPDYELKLDSITKLPKGGLALKGSFSGTLIQDVRGQKLEKAIPVKGTFEVLRASGNDAASDLLRVK
ncbi:vWA domain-containing protein [Luteolibacter sp. AS25]|uniref:vWA domain-containing protein n=1 Tax=Luteolibacter sp. AS25 TaxID=3135776 RepID=UPI00398ADC2E